MALAVAQARNNSSSGDHTVVTITTTSGSLLVIICYEGINNTSTLSITDTASQTWTQAGGYVTVSGDRCAMFYKPNSAAVTSVTATWSGGINATVPAVVFEITGAALNTPLDANASNPVTNTQTGTHASVTSGSLSTNNANDILIFGVCMSGSAVGEAAGTGYTIPTNGNTANQRACMEYKIVSATQSSTTASLTYTSNSLNQIGIFAAFADTDQGAFTPDEDFFMPIVPSDVSSNVSIW